MSKDCLITPDLWDSLYKEFMQDISSIVEKYNAEAIAKDKAEKESLYPGILMTAILDDSGLHDPKDWFQDSTNERKQDGP
jgi:hypothetical protein